ncbi:MAG: serine/threonine protein kinase, partial [Leptolyngbya sp.]|nr:serine/threonine protein kinase [Candidatus Melainabacteria bacterium]
MLEKEEQKLAEKLREDAEVISVAPTLNELVAIDAAAPEAISRPELTGETKIDGYQLEEIIGTGSTGVVYRARDIAGTKVALKLFRKELVPDVEAVKRFNKEIGTLQKLSHPNIVKMLAHGNSESGAPYTVMELVGGKSIKQTLESGNVFQPQTTAAIMRDVCRALAAAHAETVIHRDLTPANIIVGNDNVAKVVDFGIAKAVGYSGETLTQMGAVVGTPAYMSPEQCLGNDVDARSDIYSLGCTMFEMITGIKAFNSNNPVEAIAKQMSDDRSHIPKTLESSSIPKDIQAIIIKCLHKKPEQRYQTVSELDHDLSAFVLSKPLPYANVGRQEKVVWQRAVMVCSVLTLLTLGAYVALVGNLTESMQTQMPLGTTSHMSNLSPIFTVSQ